MCCVRRDQAAKPNSILGEGKVRLVPRPRPLNSVSPFGRKKGKQQETNAGPSRQFQTDCDRNLEFRAEGAAFRCQGEPTSVMMPFFQRNQPLITNVSNCCTANLLMSSDTGTRTCVHCIRGSGASAVRNQAVRFSIEFYIGSWNSPDY
eukprot:COSAG02_NODE_753_length_17610_cov_23.119753_19_plen_148_part_00